MNLASISRGMIVVNETTNLIMEVVDVNYVADEVTCEASIDGKTERIHARSGILLPSLYSRADVGNRAEPSTFAAKIQDVPEGQSLAASARREAAGMAEVIAAARHMPYLNTTPGAALLADLKEAGPEALGMTNQTTQRAVADVLGSIPGSNGAHIRKQAGLDIAAIRRSGDPRETELVNTLIRAYAGADDIPDSLYGAMQSAIALGRERLVSQAVKEPAPIVSGSLVRLKSGGPVMTAGYTVNDLTTCYWFDSVQNGQILNIVSIGTAALTLEPEGEPRS